MAAVTVSTLRLKFLDAAGGSKTVNLTQAKTTATKEQVTALMDACVTNGAIWAAAPTKKVSAAMVSTTTTDLEIVAD